MARGKSKFRPKRRAKGDISDNRLKRFAGSSGEDEDDDDEQVLENSKIQGSSDEESTPEDDNSERINSSDEIEEDDELEPDVFIQSSSAKMSNVMAKILGNSNQERPITSVVLSKTTTPLQKMQMKQKEETKAMKEKRRDNRELSLTALHIPLSVATTNTIKTGQNSVAKELEQERLHRRVATRGVVALFNAITQHQRVSESSQTVSKSNDETKLTKHTFLSKIKNAASASTDEKSAGGNDASSAQSSKWDALDDGFLLNHKKNWDEESSDDANDSFDDEKEHDVEASTTVQSRKKRRHS